MKKVAIISINGASNAGGVERVVDLHRNMLLDAGVDVKIISLPESGLFSEILKKNKFLKNIALIFFPIISPFIAKIIVGPNGTIFSHGFSSIGFFSDAVLAHGNWAAFSKAMNLPLTLYSRMIFSYERLSGKFSKRVIAVSDVVADAWRNYYDVDQKKIEIIYNSVDFVKFKFKSDLFSINNKKIKVLFVGRLEEAKGLKYLIKLDEEIQKNNIKNIELIACSSSEPSAAVRVCLPNWKILVNQDQNSMVDNYNNADLMLLPSRYEAFELCTLEALGCGTPVMLNDTGSRPSLIKLNCPGLYEISDEESPLIAVKNASEKFSQLDREALSEWVRNNFSSSIIRDRLINIVFYKK